LEQEGFITTSISSAAVWRLLDALVSYFFFGVMMKTCLDLFCCGGGASMGYSMAGYDVTGIDIVPQLKYPFKFVQADAIEYLRRHGHEFDFIHASPPCQGYSHLTPDTHKDNHAKLIPELRKMLKKIGKPYCIITQI